MADITLNVGPEQLARWHQAFDKPGQTFEIALRRALNRRARQELSTTNADQSQSAHEQSMRDFDDLLDADLGG